MSFSSPPRPLRPAALLCLAAALLLAASGCGRSERPAGAGTTTTTTTETARGEEGGAARNGAPIAVTTSKATARQIPSYVQATGSLSANETSDVAPQTSGQVVATPVSVGAFVRQGAVIARLNDRDARLRLRQSQAAVQQAVAGVRQAEARLGLGPQ